MLADDQPGGSGSFDGFCAHGDRLEPVLWETASGLFQSQLYHAAVEPRAGDPQQPGGLGFVPFRPRQRPAYQLPLDPAEILVQDDGFVGAAGMGRGLGRHVQPLGQVLDADSAPFARPWASATTSASSSRLPGQP